MDIIKKKTQKIILLLFCLALLPIISNQAHAQDEQQYPMIMFIAEDSEGNKDTVKVIFHPESTDGLDAELGEINLYEMPAEKDLDLRIIRRNDTLWRFPLYLPEKDREAYWLYSNFNNDPNYGGYGIPAYVDYDVYVRTSPSNFDFKTEYLPDTWKFLIESSVSIKLLNAKNYPVSVKYETKNFPMYYWSFLTYVVFDNNYNPIAPASQMNTLEIAMPHPNENLIVAFHFGLHASIYGRKEPKILFPNPSNNIIMLEDCNLGEEYAIMDYNGLILKTDIINEDCSIDISFLPKSMYFIKIKNNIYKLVKEGK